MGLLFYTVLYVVVIGLGFDWIRRVSR